MIESVLVATDGSEAAAAAERYAVTLCARLKGRLRGVTVVEERYLQGPREVAPLSTKATTTSPRFSRT